MFLVPLVRRIVAAEEKEEEEEEEEDEEEDEEEEEEPFFDFGPDTTFPFAARSPWAPFFSPFGLGGMNISTPTSLTAVLDENWESVLPVRRVVPRPPPRRIEGAGDDEDATAPSPFSVSAEPDLTLRAEA